MARKTDVAVATAAGSAVDTGDREYYRASETGVSATLAIRAALGREGYICWLRGTIMRYLWRADAKEQAHPAEYAVKSTWYSQELARVLADPTA